jgi:hypothetical protein
MPLARRILLTSQIVLMRYWKQDKVWLYRWWAMNLWFLLSFFFVLFLMMQLFNEFSILSWNNRGVVNSQGKRNYRDLVYKYQPSLFVILETHALFARVENYGLAWVIFQQL